MIVSGCAGSGKSVIAMYKAQQIIEEGGDVILIAYTKSLNRYSTAGGRLFPLQIGRFLLSLAMG